MFGIASKPPTPIYDFLASVIPRLVPVASWRHSLQDGSSPLLAWRPGQTPMSTFSGVLFAGTFYLALIFGIRELMTRNNVKAFSLKIPFVIHNFLLSAASGLLLACMLEEIVPIWRQYGFYHAICASSAWTSRMETLYIFVSRRHPLLT